MESPYYFYLFPKGDDYEIRRMTDEEALNQGRPFLDVGQKTFEAAWQLGQLYLAEHKAR